MSDYTREDFNSFCEVIKEMLALFSDLIGFENKKLDAIAANDVALLDQYMKDEQVYLLKMKGLEQKREKVQEQLGAAGLSFSELIGRFSGPEQDALNALYDELSAKTTEVKDAVTGTKRYIDLHLNSITALLEKLEGNAATYGKDGVKKQKAPPARFSPTKA